MTNEIKSHDIAKVAKIANDMFNDNVNVDNNLQLSIEDIHFQERITMDEARNVQIQLHTLCRTVDFKSF